MAQKKRQPRPSWFKKSQDKDGVNFIYKLSSMDIKRNALNILRDFSRGNVKESEYVYFTNSNLLNGLLQYCNEEGNKNFTEMQVLLAYINSPNMYNLDLNIVNSLYTEKKRMCDIFVICQNNINQISFNLQVGATDEVIISNIKTWYYQLSQYKYNI